MGEIILQKYQSLNFIVEGFIQSKFLLTASELPKEPGEFYQFCYVGQSNEVLGASIPFQFQSASDEDLCEIDEDDLLVVRSKTAVLQEQIQKV